MEKRTDMPMVGIGVFVMRHGKCLVGKRKGSHGAGLSALPGGHVEKGETLVQAAHREVKEETGLQIDNVQVLTAVDAMFPEEDLHYVTVLLMGRCVGTEEPRNLEPDKKEGWDWYVPDKIPQPMMPCLPEGIKKLRDLFELDALRDRG